MNEHLTLSILVFLLSGMNIFMAYLHWRQTSRVQRLTRELRAARQAALNPLDPLRNPQTRTERTVVVNMTGRSITPAEREAIDNATDQIRIVSDALTEVGEQMGESLVEPTQQMMLTMQRNLDRIFERGRLPPPTARPRPTEQGVTSRRGTPTPTPAAPPQEAPTAWSHLMRETDDET